MPILIVILIGWFNWLVYSAHHRLQPLSAKTSRALDYWHCNSLKYPHLWTALAAPQYSSHFSCHGTSFQCSWVHCQPMSGQSCRQLSWGHDDFSLQQRSVRL